LSIIFLTPVIFTCSSDLGVAIILRVGRGGKSDVEPIQETLRKLPFWWNHPLCHFDVPITILINIGQVWQFAGPF